MNLQKSIKNILYSQLYIQTDNELYDSLYDTVAYLPTVHYLSNTLEDKLYNDLLIKIYDEIYNELTKTN
jgi:hypothetical protein